MPGKCNHEFVATSRKGEWTVKVRSTNNRGTPDDETVDTTVFECDKCGKQKEFPDYWEKNYVAPEEVSRKKVEKVKRRKPRTRKGNKNRKTDCA